jgi:YgiT-type zinc finger domain-containing protein
MICEYCRGRTISKQVKRQHWLNGQLYILENVPAVVCTDCGERYFHAATLDDIDRLLLADHAVKETLNVEVVTLARSRSNTQTSIGRSRNWSGRSATIRGSYPRAPASWGPLIPQTPFMAYPLGPCRKSR